MILGLGNPGERFRGTRHNRGREVVEELARRLDLRFDLNECHARLAHRDDLMLALPETFMNRSGYSARCLAERRDVSPSRILVVYDDIALPLGSLRFRPGGGPGGQKGMASIIENLQSQRIPRLRLGILPEAGWDEDNDLSEFVLSAFDQAELEASRSQVQRAAEACEFWLREGSERAMNEFNAPITEAN